MTQRTLLQKLIFLLSILCLTTAFAINTEATLDGNSYVEYTASTNNRTGHIWSGRAPINSLQLNFDTTDVRNTFMLKIIVRSGGFDSGNFILDANGRAAVFESRDYPEIVFQSDSSDLVALTEETDEATVTGTLTMHGVTREITVPVGLEYSPTTLTVQGTLDVLLSDFNMKRPSNFGNTVDDEVSIFFIITTILTQ